MGVYVLLESGGYRGDKGADPDTPLIEAEFRTLVELKLRQSGIQVVGVQDHLADPYYPRLYLQVNNMVKNGLMFYSISLSLKQWCKSPTASIKTAEGISSTGGYFEPWGSAGSIGTIGKYIACEGIKEDVGGYVDQFCNDWLTANPKN